jgi:hypothetical protein
MQRTGQNRTRETAYRARRTRPPRCACVHLLAPLLPLLALLAFAAAPALAAPTFGITMEHHNAYGAQAASCPGSHESLPGEPDCGVDPYTGSGTTFARESGFNSYTINVKNTSVAGGPETLVCQAGDWTGEPTFSYQWLRNGVPIAGAESSEYTVTAEDEGTGVQCAVTATNEGGAAAETSASFEVPPPSATKLPVLESGRPYIEGEEAAGQVLTCNPNAAAWTGGPIFTYLWTRNAAPIAGANSDEYTVTTADEGASVQCRVAASNAGGSTVAFTRQRVIAPGPTTGAPESEVAPQIKATNGSEIKGQVAVADQLPEGLVLAGSEPNIEVSGQHWTCVPLDEGREFTCVSEQTVQAGEEYEPITLHVHVESSASASLTNVASVSGGGASIATTYDQTAITPAVPFGIQSFITSVTNLSDDPFTQAGGHPFAATAMLLLNDDAVNDEDATETSGGTTKAIETELPPGFLGNPQNTVKCPLALAQHTTYIGCPNDTAVGFVTPGLSAEHPIEEGKAHPLGTKTFLVYSFEPTPGAAAIFGFKDSAFFAITAKLRSDGNYGITIDDDASGRSGGRGLESLSLTLCSYGVTDGGLNPNSNDGDVLDATCAQPGTGAKPFLTNPTRCSGSAPATTLRADTYQDPSAYVSKTVYTGSDLTASAPSLSESFVTGCSALQFDPEAELAPSSSAEGGTTQADEPTGATFSLKVPQPEEDGTDATPELKNATVTLPQGMTIDPAAANGLQACSNAQFGVGSTVEPAPLAFCPLASQIGSVKIVTPLLERPLEGQVFLGEPECSPCTNTDAEDGHLFRLFLQAHSEERGVTIKLAGKVTANPSTGQLQATFTEQPQLPFSELLLTFNGGARASLANPQTCGTYTTSTDLTPWSTPGLGGLSGTELIAGTPDAYPSSSFAVTGCGASMPFAPSFSAGSQAATAGASSPFSVTFGREDREQDLSAISVTTPPGLLGEVSQVPRCAEGQANAGTCGAESLIGSTTVGAGPGTDPFYLSGKVYLTGPYKGAPFGLSIVVPAVAGPFNLGNVVVRATIAVNPSTAALTITSDPLPQYVDGVQLRLRKINVEINRPGFMLNPTNCAQQTVAATLTAAQGASSSVATPYEVGNCANLPFTPKLTATAGGKGTKAGGSSLDVKIASAGLGQANIAKVDLELPKSLSTRDSTLNKACTEGQFATNPAGCPEGSIIGKATIHTPILASTLAGPAYLVSHGGAAFPDVEIVLQGEGVTLVLDGKTDIKHGITYSRFESTPDAPFTTFETELPTGPHSIFTANVPAKDDYSLCGQTLAMPTIVTGQDGKQLKQTTKVTVTGCKATKPLTRTQKLTAAIRQCKKKQNKRKRAGCEAQARKTYGPLHAKKSKRTFVHGKGRK